MPRYVLLMLLLKGTWLLFAMALGGCIGSLINVVAYRMPRGISVVSPPSRCPSCGTRLTWRENIPVFGWLLLRGKCRFCKARISPEYPVVEASVALLFGLLYAVCYLLPPGWTWLGVEWGQMRPEWALGEVKQTWPLFVVVLTIFGSLAAMTLVDAKTFTIPLTLTWIPAVVGLAVHVGWAVVVSLGPGSLQRTAVGWDWSLATPGPDGWGAVGGSIGAVVGLGVGLLLLKARLITRSFDDYDDWERETFGEAATHDVPGVEAPAHVPARPARAASRLVGFVVMIVCPVAGVFVGPRFGVAGGIGLLIGAAAGPLVAGLVTLPFRLGAPAPEAAEGGEEAPPAVWTQYPHARREMVREMAFLAPAAILGLGGWMLAIRLAGPWSAHPITGVLSPATPVPLWLSVASGVLLGYLVGGGVVWAVRIFGSLAFGKEAMGLGDVHLMGAVGACLGWIDATIAFFLAAFVGVYWAILGRISSGGLARAMPYGPFLAVATLLVFVGKPVVEVVLTRITGAPARIDLP